MGYHVEFNWVLKLRADQGLDEERLEVGKDYGFQKQGNRIYPVGIPIDLINGEWVRIGKAVVKEATNTEGKTEGTYMVLELFSKEAREKIMKG